MVTQLQNHRRTFLHRISCHEKSLSLKKKTSIAYSTMYQNISQIRQDKVVFVLIQNDSTSCTF